jgi:flagellar basal body-associated protein FliL
MESVQSYPQNTAPVVMTANGQQKSMFRMVLLVLLAAAMAALYYVVFHEETPPSKPTQTSKSIAASYA